MQRYILTTGPSLGGLVPINAIHNDKFIYRINGAHGDCEQISSRIDALRKQVDGCKILMDLPGNKVRTANLGSGIKIQKDHEFILKRDNFNFTDFGSFANKGDLVYANDSTFLFEVLSVNSRNIVFLSHSDGILENGKGMHIRGLNEKLPFLFERDLKLIELAKQKELDYIGASFVRNANDVRELQNKLYSKQNKQKLCPIKPEIFCKIETLSAVHNLASILDVIDYALIDRGDLSAEIGIEKTPRFQEHIIEQAHVRGVKIFLATQILKNMQNSPLPTIAEIDDLYTISKSGVYGVQLSEETAIGFHVKRCIEVLENMQCEVQRERIVL